MAIVATRRTRLVQMALFQKGRTFQNGMWVKTGRTVTNALPEKSPHCPHVDSNGNVGCAAYDLAVVVNEKPVWEHPAYDDVLGPQGEAAGLAWGGRWKSLIDADHFELESWRSMPLATGAEEPQRHGLTD